MTALRSRLILPILGSLLGQVVVLGLLGDEISVPMGRVGVPTAVAWCFPASLTVGLVVESHTEHWDWENPSRVLGVEAAVAALGVLASVAIFRSLQDGYPPAHVWALWAFLLAVGTCLRPAIGPGAWLAALAAALIVFYWLASPGSALVSFVIDHAWAVASVSLVATATVRALRRVVASSPGRR
jgi:hypothetical protein